MSEDLRVIDNTEYAQCYRCGIRFEAADAYVAVFCRDCLHPDLIGVFRPVDYSFIFEGEK